MSQRFTAAVLASLLVGPSGCSPTTPLRSVTPGSCEAGQAHCGCLANDTCLQGLVCAAGTCRDAQVDPSSAGDSAAGETIGGDPMAPSGHPSSGEPGPDACGGIAGTPCPRPQQCFFEDGQCGMTDLLGTCADVPTVCLDVWDPVCGCDRHTYGNQCKAHAALAQIDHAGACEQD